MIATTRYGWSGGNGACVCLPGGCVCVPAYGPSWGPGTPEEAVDELEDYKERLELEIRDLERRIQKLREQAQ